VSPRYGVTYRWRRTGELRRVVRECDSAFGAFLLFVLTVVLALELDEESPLEIFDVSEEE